jgi:hypothetical protein
LNSCGGTGCNLISGTSTLTALFANSRWPLSATKSASPASTSAAIGFQSLLWSIFPLSPSYTLPI